MSWRWKFGRGCRVKWFTADQHFGHRNIIEFMKRPFADVVEMRERMLQNINEVVREKDELYLLGDFSLHFHADDVKALTKRIVCKNTTLIFGNHDSSQHGQCFMHAYDMLRVKDNHRSFLLCHYPLRSWRADFQLHGHNHGKMKAYPGQLDVGVDTHDYRPWSLPEVVEFVEKRDRGVMVANACKQRWGDRLVVGGYGEVTEEFLARREEKEQE